VDDLSPNMKSSALEVCETSAIGRALANLGYAPKGKRPSREEMASVSAKGKGGAEEITGGGPAVREDAAAHGAEPASPGYSKSQAACASTDHKDNRGRRHLKDGLCELCGMNAIAAMEGTTADLGSA
jgi:hypothetical protein